MILDVLQLCIYPRINSRTGCLDGMFADHLPREGSDTSGLDAVVDAAQVAHSVLVVSI